MESESCGHYHLCGGVLITTLCLPSKGHGAGFVLFGSAQPKGF